MWTDGSARNVFQPPSVRCTGAWAFNLVASLAPDASSNQLLARYGGLVETDVEHPEWCGAERATIGAAEMTAVLKALVWISALLTFVDNFPC